jgi:hypothetical protein
MGDKEKEDKPARKNCARCGRKLKGRFHRMEAGDVCPGCYTRIKGKK